MLYVSLPVYYSRGLFLRTRYNPQSQHSNYGTQQITGRRTTQSSVGFGDNLHRHREHLL